MDIVRAVLEHMNNALKDKEFVKSLWDMRLDRYLAAGNEILANRILNNETYNALRETIQDLRPKIAENLKKIGPAEKVFSKTIIALGKYVGSIADIADLGVAISTNDGGKVFKSATMVGASMLLTAGPTALGTPFIPAILIGGVFVALAGNLWDDLKLGKLLGFDGKSFTDTFLRGCDIIANGIANANEFLFSMILPDFLNPWEVFNRSSEAYYVVLGVKPDKTREVLGIYNAPTESASTWDGT